MPCVELRMHSSRENDVQVTQNDIHFNLIYFQEVEADTFESLLSEDGILAISAKMKEVPPQEEKIIDIKHDPRKKDSDK